MYSSYLDPRLNNAWLRQRKVGEYLVECLPRDTRFLAASTQPTPPRLLELEIHPMYTVVIPSYPKILIIPVQLEAQSLPLFLDW